MATVSSIVVRRRLATMRQVEDALARQTLYGGDVVTNLLEVAPPPATDEAALTAALAEALELPAADAVALRSPDAAAVARVPRDLAERHGFVPIAVREGSVVVALAEPLSEAAVEEVSTALGTTVRQEAAPIVRLRQALERAYGVAMDRRTRRLASILDGGDTKQSVPPPRRSLIPDVPDDPLQIAPAPKPVAIKEAVPEAHPEASPTPATTIRSAKPGADALRWFAKAARDAAPKKRDSSPRMSAAGRRRRGPFTRADAEKVFADPESTDAVLGALLEFAQQFFSFVALFLVQEEVAEGWDALGAGASGDRVRKMGVPLDLPSAFSEARETRAAVLRPRKKDGLDE
ncbi:MAG: GspE/PulE/PilB domain-containing protein, partial [Polyangiales bacterium]